LSHQFGCGGSGRGGAPGGQRHRGTRNLHRAIARLTAKHAPGQVLPGALMRPAGGARKNDHGWNFSSCSECRSFSTVPGKIGVRQSASDNSLTLHGKFSTSAGGSCRVCQEEHWVRIVWVAVGVYEVECRGPPISCT